MDRFSLEYRKNLANELVSINKVHRKHVLKSLINTLDYKLAKEERRAKLLRGEDFKPEILEKQKYLQEKTEKGFNQYAISNEPFLHMFSEYTKDKKGCIVGVGVDQVLELFSAGNYESAIIVDVTKQTSQITRFLLELGLRHKKTFGDYPTSKEFREYFSRDNKKHIERFLRTLYSEEDSNNVMECLYVDKHAKYSADFCYKDYQDHKASLQDEKGNSVSFYNGDEKLRHILESYENEKIVVINGDFTKKSTINNINLALRGLHNHISTIYFSNAEDYFQESHKDVIYNMSLLPMEKDALILRTDINYDIYRLHVPIFREKKKIKGLVIDDYFQPFLYMIQPFQSVMKKYESGQYNSLWRTDSASGNFYKDILNKKYKKLKKGLIYLP